MKAAAQQMIKVYAFNCMSQRGPSIIVLPNKIELTRHHYEEECTYSILFCLEVECDHWKSVRTLYCHKIRISYLVFKCVHLWAVTCALIYQIRLRVRVTKHNRVGSKSRQSASNMSNINSQYI